MARRHYQAQLDELHSDIILMGQLVEKAITDSVQAFENYDIELCKAIIDQDKVIDGLEKSIESKCLWLIAREQPVASDLRQITTALKMITDIERIGDNAADIASITLRLAKKNTFANTGKIPQMADLVIKMVRNAVDAYIRTDLELAKATRLSDDEVDQYFHLIKRELNSIFSDNDDNMDSALDFLLIAKYFERIADHAGNICEWVEFSVKGRHKNSKIF
jgi:phosphate transport system protein